MMIEFTATNYKIREFEVSQGEIRFNYKAKKLKKLPRNIQESAKNFGCGGCSNEYKSYPALYLHIKRKHSGIRPPNTRIHRPQRPKLHIAVQPGRPNRPKKDIDNLDEVEATSENAQNDLMSLLGEKLLMTSDLGPKVSLEAIELKILEVCKDHTDQWSTDLLKEIKNFLLEYKDNDSKLKHLDFDEDFVQLDPNKGLRVVAWFLIWLAKIYVKIEFVPDLCIIFSKIWKVLDQNQLSVQDLDNKLVWKKVLKDCEGHMSSMVAFKNDVTLLGEFVQKVCQLAGKVFEDK